MPFDAMLQKILRSSFYYGRKTIVFLYTQTRQRLSDKKQSRETKDSFPRSHFGAEQATGRKGILPKSVLKTEQIRTLEAMSEDVKILYTRILAAQALVDRQLEPSEFSDLYVFMAQIGLSAAARDQVRKTLASENVNLVTMVDQLVALVKPEEQAVIKFSIIKDLLRVSRMDGQVSPEEWVSVRTMAAHLYPEADDAEQILQFAERAIEYDERLLMGKLTIDEFTTGAKNLAATAASIGVPITAVYFSGSVIGLSAAGIISGLTALGLGGILGLSSLVTGIGVVVVMGLVTFKLVRWAITGQERKMEQIREHMVQEIIKLNQQAMVALSEDLNTLTGQLAQVAVMSDENRKMLAKLHELYQDAMHRLEARKGQYVRS